MSDLMTSDLWNQNRNSKYMGIRKVTKIMELFVPKTIIPSEYPGLLSEFHKFRDANTYKMS